MTTQGTLAAAIAVAAQLFAACGDDAKTAPENAPPVATITAPGADTSVEVGDSVSFEGACVDPEETAVTHAWDFGSVAPASTVAKPDAIVFGNAGAFTVSYTCSDAEGRADATPATRKITVTAKPPSNVAPSASITAPAADVSIAEGESVSFAGSCSDPEGSPVTHLWKFAGAAADSDEQDPGAVVFAAPGTYVVTYTCIDAEGLGDGTPATRTITVTATVNLAPSASITEPAADVVIVEGESVSFAGACADPEDGALTHLWDFDGAAADSTELVPGEVTFADAGEYTVSYTCTDAQGLAGAPATRVITVDGAPVNQPPVASITAPAGDVEILEGEGVTFAGSCVDPEDGGALTHLWTFDGAAPDSTEQDPGVVVFAAAGDYHVTYSCGDGEGLASPGPATRTVTVSKPANLAPVATITAPASNIKILVGESVSFAGACADPEASGVTHSWDFGGGAADSSEQSPGAVVFAAVGDYAVTYTCADALGLADATPARVTVKVVATPIHEVAGRATFDKVPSTLQGLDFAHVEDRPLRGVDVSIVDAADLDVVVATAVTDDDGAFSASWDPSGPAVVRVLVHARTASPIITVKDNTAGASLFAMSSSDVDTATTFVVDLHAAHGWTGSAYSARSAAPFAVLDAAYEAVVKFRAVRPAVVFPDLDIFWSENNAPTTQLESETEAEALLAGRIGTSHWDGTALYILGLEDVDTDEFDDHTIVHEWGHYFESKLSRSDSPGGTHGSGDLKDPRLTFGEGWGNALGSIVWYPKTTYSDASGPMQAEGFGFDIEDNLAEDPNPGWFSEASMQSILLDLYDDSGASEAFDQVALGLGPIYDAMVGAQKSTPALTTIYSFVTALKAANPASSAAIDMLTLYNDVVGAPIVDAFGSTETIDGGNPSVLPIYTSLADGAATVAIIGAEIFNALGQIRYLYFVGDGAEHTITIETTDEQDADIAVYRSGVLVTESRFDGGSETTPAFVAESGVQYIVVIGGPAVAEDCEVTVTLD